MARRQDHFGLATDALRRRIRDGLTAPGAPLIVGDIANDLSISATPVREALSRLAGEGLIEDRRGRGYFAYRLEASDLQQIYQLHYVYVLGALALRSALDPPITQVDHARPEPEVPEHASVAQSSERLFADLIATAHCPSLTIRQRSIADRLALPRRFEHDVVTGLDAELLKLTRAVMALKRPELEREVERYHQRRLERAQALAIVIRSAFG